MEKVKRKGHEKVSRYVGTPKPRANKGGPGKDNAAADNMRKTTFAAICLVPFSCDNTAA